MGGSERDNRPIQAVEFPWVNKYVIVGIDTDGGGGEETWDLPPKSPMSPPPRSWKTISLEYVCSTHKYRCGTSLQLASQPNSCCT